MWGRVSISSGRAAAGLHRHIPSLFKTAVFIAALSTAAPLLAAQTVGATRGEFSIDLSGAATYRIPVALPQGVHGMKPGLSMIYSSSAGMGLLGNGWSMTGMSMISRCARNLDQDGMVSVPVLSTGDGLCLDGQRLVATSGSYGAAGSVYHTELDTFEQVTAGSTVPAGPCALGVGPASFTAVDREGKTYQFGNTADSTLTGTGYSTGNPTGVTWCANPTRLVWPVTQITDKYGNFIRYTYTNLQNGVPTNPANFYIQEIDYGSAAGTVAKVIFSYATTFNNLGYSLDIYQQYTYATLTETSPALMTGIQVYGGSGNLLHSYTLGYSAPALTTTAQPAELTSVTECGIASAGDTSSSLCYAPTTFSYQGAGTGFVSASAIATTMPTANGVAERRVLDLDGDGLPDYIYASGSSNEFYVVFGKNLEGAPIDTGFNAQTCTDAHAGNPTNCNYDLSSDAVIVDVFGDGKQELMLPYYVYDGNTSSSRYIWKMFAWNGSTANPNMVASDPPVMGGGALVAPQCTTPFPSCGADLGIDLTGSGLSDIVFNYNGHLNYFVNNNGAFNPTPVQSSVAVSGQPKLYQVNYTGTGTAEMYVANTGIVQAVTQAQGAGTAPLLKGLSLYTSQHFDDSHENALIFFNADGSGLTSALWVDNSSPADNQWVFYPNTGTGWSFPSATPNYNYATCDSSGAPDAQTIDWYGDGRQELLFPSNGTWHMLGAYDGTIGPGCSDTGISATGDAHSSLFLDLNGDGFPDLIYSSGGYYSYILNSAAPYVLSQITDGFGLNTNVDYVTLSQAAYTIFIGTTPSPAVNAPQVISLKSGMYVARDFAADNGMFNSDGTPQRIYTYYKYAGPAADQWGRGFLGFSQVETVNYNTGIFTLSKYSQSFPTIGMLTEADKSVSTQANLSAPQPVVIKGTGGGVKCYFNKTLQEPDCPVSTPQYEPAQFDTGHMLSQTINTLAVVNPYGSLGIYVPYTQSTTTNLYELVNQTANQPPAYETVTTTSNYGVPPGGAGTPIGTDVVDLNKTTTTTDANKSSDVASVTTVNTYNDESTCPGQVTHVQVTDSFNEPAATTYPAKIEDFAYDSNCGLKQDAKTIVAPNPSEEPSQQLTKTYAYTGSDPYTGATVSSPFGEAISVTTTGSALTSRTSYMSYDPTLRFPVAISNALGQTENLTYDDWGNKLTDLDANGDQIIYAYDGFERKLSATGPMLGVTTTWSYGPCSNSVTLCLAAPSVAYAVTETDPDGNSTTTQYDGLGRQMRTTRTGFNKTTLVSGVNYDLLGRVAGKSRPSVVGVGGPGCWTFNTYDVLNRLIKKDDPTTQSLCAGWQTDNNDRVTTISYSGLSTTTTVVNPNNTGGATGSESSTTVNNVLDKPDQVSDATGNVNSYLYDPWGNPTAVTSPGATGTNTVSMVYDSDGRKLSMQDPDMGGWSYVYDALGELLTQTDAKGQQVMNTYDSLGRLVQRVEPEGTSTWTYDIGYGAGIGQLAYKVADNGLWEGYAYDPYGHITDKITVLNGQEYWVTSTYDPLGRVSQVVYPELSGINVSGTPGTPSGLTVVQGPPASWIHVNWTVVNQGEVYHLYRTLQSASAPTAANQIYSGPYPSFIDTGITANGSYTWWLQACNDNSCSGYAKSSVSIVLPPAVPLPPSVPLQDTHQQTITVNWSPVSMIDATSPGPVQYRLLESTDQTNYGNVYTGNATSASVTLPTDGIYWFEVRACTSTAYCSSPSEPSGAYSTYMLPGLPTSPNSTTVVNSASYNVGWTAPSFIPSSGVTYVLQEAHWVTNKFGGTSKTPYTTVYTGSAPSTSITQTLDGNYFYQVEACNASPKAPGLCTAFVAAGQYTVTVPPSQPGAITFSPATDDHSGYWTVGWGASMLTSGSTNGVTYNLTELFSGSYYQSSSGSMNSVGLSHKPSGTYTYYVVACSNSSVTSNQACSTRSINNTGYTTVITPPAPASVNVPSQSDGNGAFTVTWSGPGGYTVTGYNLQVYDLACTDPPNAKCITVLKESCTPSPPTNTTCTFAGHVLPAGQNGYGLQVRADNSGQQGAWAQASAPTIWYLQPPAAPTINGGSFSATGSYTITWTTPATTTYFNLYKQVGTAAFTQVYSGASTSYSSSIGPKSAGQSYYVIACNSAGCGAPSATISVTYDGGGTGCPPPPNQCQLVFDDRYSANTPRPAGILPADLAGAPAPEMDKAAAIEVRAPAAEELGLPVLSTTPEFLSANTPAVQAPPAPSIAMVNQISAGVATRSPYAMGRSVVSTRPAVSALTGDSIRRVAAVTGNENDVRWPPQPVDPILSKYPPLRHDPRVMAHYESLGGVAPAEATPASSSEPTAVALMVQYHYDDPHGYLTSVTRLDANANPIGQLWVAEDMNGYGIVDQAGYDAPAGGGTPALQIIDSYDAATGLLGSTSVAAGPANQAVSVQYGWDGYGDLTSRSLSQNGTTAMGETFTYDQMNRLKTVTSNAGGNSSFAANYNADGSVQTNGGYTGYQYTNAGYSVAGYSYSQPHAVSQVTLSSGVVRSFQYDPDGNLQQVAENGTATKNVTWTSFNKPLQIQNLSGGATENFGYDADHERITTSLSQSSGTDTTTYIDGLFEAESNSATQLTSYRHYILVGNARAGVETVTVNSSGSQQSDTLGFLIHDEVGSVIGQVTEGLGGTNQQVALYSYDAWGKERPTSTNPALGQTAFQDPSSGSFMTGLSGQHEGYAGHENEASLGLVEMEGRVYDPEIGRFLSPDPNVQYPNSTQGMDRYAYVGDNPLSANDPSGFITWHDVLNPATSDNDVAVALADQGRYARRWILHQLSPQEFAIVNMIGSHFCGYFAFACSAAGTYEYDRANNVPVGDAVRAGVASAVEEEAAELSSYLEGKGVAAGAAGHVYRVEGAAIAYSGGYMSSYIQGGDGSVGGERGLFMYGLNVAMDNMSNNNVNMQTAKSGGEIKNPGEGCPGYEFSCTGKEIDASTDKDGNIIPAGTHFKDLTDAQRASIGCTWSTECGGFFQWAAQNVPGVQGFSLWHDQFFRTWPSAKSSWSWVVPATVPLFMYISYEVQGAQMQYYLLRDPAHYH